MNYEKIKNIQIGDFRTDIATSLLALGMYIPIPRRFHFSPSNLNLFMRKRAQTSLETPK